MRVGAMLLTLMLLCGCAASAPTTEAEPLARAEAPASADVSGKSAFDEAVAAALVFDPPVALGEPELLLARDQRQAGAFVGFDQVTTTFSYVRIDDRQRLEHGHFHDRVERRAISVRMGSSTR